MKAHEPVHGLNERPTERTAERGKIMNRKLTALTMSAAIAAGLGTAAVPAAHAFADGQGAAVTQSSRPNLEQAKQQLIEKTGTTRLSVVDGLGYAQDQIYVGAVLTDHNTVQFFVNPGSGWLASGEKSLPQTYGTGEQPTVSGASVQGAQYPMFVVDGAFTGNGTGQALLFAHDINKGWGVMVGKGDHLVPSGHGYTDLGDPGLELKISIDDGVVTTHSLWGPQYDEANVEQTTNPIVRTWTGTGGDTLTMRSEHGGPID